jgi:D-sedoheptulose 7-phosphate isomerase
VADPKREIEEAELRDFIVGELRKTASLMQSLALDDAVLELVGKVAIECVAALRRGNKILLAGNGGSAADAQHIAAELVGRFWHERAALSALALTTDTSALTAIGNDYGFDRVFARQVEALGRKGDVFFGISTSGRSRNVLNALRECRAKGIVTVGLTGQSGGDMRSLCDLCVSVPSNETPRIQEGHITIGHIICSLVEHTLFASPGS